MWLARILPAPFIALWVLVVGAGSSASDRPVVGWVERVKIYPGEFEIHAKIDTGAKTSSLNAPNMQIFKRDGEEWVSFEVTNRKGKSRKFEEKIVRVSRIRRHGGRLQRRPVVMLGVCVGNVFRQTQVNLIDRKNFNYQMLIGRRFLTDRVVVDPGRTFIARPSCKQGAEN
jgi:hypothetical protein